MFEIERITDIYHVKILENIVFQSSIQTITTNNGRKICKNLEQCLKSRITDMNHVKILENIAVRITEEYSGKILDNV